MKMTKVSSRSVAAPQQAQRFIKFVLLMFGVLMLLVLMRPSAKSATSSWPYLPNSANAHSEFRKKTDLGKGEIDGTEFFWQLPPYSYPKAILFLAHGCSHSMTDWFPQSSACPDCIGLPEEMAIVKLALEKLKVVVVAMSSLDREGSKCWAQNDGPVVAKVLSAVNAYFDVPVFAFGASSGGGFVSSILPKAMEQEADGALRGYISQIFAASGASQMPAVFVTMNRDEVTDRKAKQLVVGIREKGIPALHVRLASLPLTESFFSERIDNIDQDLSKQMFQDLRRAKMVDNDGMLVEDPRRSDWRSVLGSYAAKVGDSMVPDASPLSEVMNVAWGMHEMTRDGVKDAVEFLLN